MIPISGFAARFCTIPPEPRQLVIDGFLEGIDRRLLAFMEGSLMKRLTVVIIDDEQIILEGFTRLVKWDEIGCTVVATATDGVEGEALIKELRPDIVVTDINMPLVNGLDMIKSVHEDRPETVFIIISGYDDFSYVREALKLQVYDYLLKPVDFRQFEGVIRTLRAERFKEFDEVNLIDHITAYINQHYAKHLSLQTLSQVFFLTPAYLSHYFKNKRGVNYYRYLTGVRINRACELLAGSDMPIARIASLVGVDDYRTFTKLFRREKGVSPSEYRRLSEGKDAD